MIHKADPRGFHRLVEGVEMNTLAFGQHTLMAEVRLAQGAVIPPHAHIHEQTGYLVCGCLRLIDGDKTEVLEPGDSWSIPGGQRHGAEALDDCIVVEVFSPVREEYLPKHKADGGIQAS